MAGAKADRRVYRTADGQLVGEGDPQAAFLAYPVGEDVADDDADAYRALVAGGRAKAAAKPTDKAAAKPADKAAQKPADK